MKPQDYSNFKYTIGDYNMVLDTDSYKLTMPFQYPPNTTQIFSYTESRGGLYDSTVFFGLQYYLKEFLSRPITKDNIDEAEDIAHKHFGRPIFYREGWEHILNKHGGYLPLEIRAIPEGLVVPTSHFMSSVTNTDDKCQWLPTHIETGSLRTSWYGTTTATQDYHIKQLIKKNFEDTVDDENHDLLDFMLHDFGARGCSSYETSCIGGLSHLVNFRGTDTLNALRYGRKYYNEDMAGFSVPASEHSTMTAWGKAREDKAYGNMLEKFGARGQIVSIVADSYDVINAVKNIFARQYKWWIEEIGGTLVIRPDSGVPHEIVLQIVEALGATFGFTVNKKGYRVLNPCVRVLQGDGINYTSINEICVTLKFHGWSVENVRFGMGGAMLQGTNRDTQKFALKCSAALINGEWTDVYKDPITDSGKRSKRGIISLFKHRQTGEYLTERLNTINLIDYEDMASVVYKNGEVLIDDSLSVIRQRVK